MYYYTDSVLQSQKKKKTEKKINSYRPKINTTHFKNSFINCLIFKYDLAKVIVIIS